ncbi:MAG: hypothetical protein M3552_14510 [Planctomycetota bacterium]|nr:hypothetical protein [Planctomycetaceae bacterium]MDQ3331842.1 hypothetical protein [Planctomycetota bacterium]
MEVAQAGFASQAVAARASDPSQDALPLQDAPAQAPNSDFAIWLANEVAEQPPFGQFSHASSSFGPAATCTIGPLDESPMPKVSRRGCFFAATGHSPSSRAATLAALPSASQDSDAPASLVQSFAVQFSAVHALALHASWGLLSVADVSTMRPTTLELLLTPFPTVSVPLHSSSHFVVFTEHAVGQAEV